MSSKVIKYAGASLLMAANLLFAQDYNRIAPKTAAIENATGSLPASASTTTAKKTDATLVVSSLTGLVLLANAEDVQKGGVEVKGVSVRSLEMLERPGFEAQLQSYLGHPLTFKQLDDITHVVVSFYRLHNHPLVNVVVPEQDVSTGTIQILVTEYLVGQVKAEGNKWFSSRVITAPVGLKFGDTVDTRQLLGALDSANANPFRRVNLVYEPSLRPGYTDLVLQTQDRLPLRIYSGYDNSGSPVTGRNRWNIGVNWGNALWHDQQLSYQFTSSSNFWTGRSVSPGEPDGASFLAHSLSWTMPLSPRTSLSIFGAYEQSVPNLGQDLGLTGRSGQASIRYNVALKRTQRFVHSLQAGFDFKTTNNNLDFGGAMVSRNNTEVAQFPVAYSSTLTDHFGVTTGTTTLVFSPGGITPNNNDSAFQPADGQTGRPFARAQYIYWRNDLTRLSRLPLGATWSSRIIGQVSDRSLLDTEQLAAGGSDLLRGYDPYTLLGDEGVVLSNELRTPAFGRPGKEGLGANVLGQTQLLGFWDYAHLQNRNPADGVTPNINGSSVGVGLRYSMRTFASVRFDYGWQLQQLPSSTGRGELANISVIIGN